MLGSNQRRLSRRFYRPLSSCTSHMPLTSINVPRGQIPVRCRPSGVRAMLARAAHGQGRARSRTPGRGAVTLTVRVFRFPRCPGVHPAERGRVLLRAARVALARCHQAGRHRGVGRRIHHVFPQVTGGRGSLVSLNSARGDRCRVGPRRAAVVRCGNAGPVRLLSRCGRPWPPGRDGAGVRCAREPGRRWWRRNSSWPGGAQMHSSLAGASEEL